MKRTILFPLMLVVLMSSTAAMGATVNGVVKNSYGFRLGFADVQATEQGNPTNVVSAVADHRGKFTMTLESGTWAIALDAEELQEWGYQPLSVPLIVGGTPVSLDLVPQPIEPPIVPVLTSLDVVADRFTIFIEGGGGRIFRVERSPDLDTWYAISSFPTAKGFVSYSANFTWPDPAPHFWRVVVTE